MTANNKTESLEKQGPGADVVEAPVLALSYWVEGEPRYGLKRIAQACG